MKINALLKWVFSPLQKKVHKPTSIFTDTRVLYQANHPVRETNPVEDATLLLKVPYRNIEQYTKRLGEFTSTINKNRAVRLQLDDCELFTITIDTFFTSEDHFYINRENAYLRFQTTTIALCSALEKPPMNEDHQMVLEHNQRQLTGLVSNVQSLHTLLTTNQNQP